MFNPWSVLYMRAVDSILRTRSRPTICWSGRVDQYSGEHIMGLLTAGQSHSHFIHHNSNSIWRRYGPNSICGHQIALSCCTCHDSTAVVARTKFCSDHIIIIWIIPKRFFHWIDCVGKSIVKWTPYFGAPFLLRALWLLNNWLKFRWPHLASELRLWPEHKMMTSWHINTLLITGPLWGESTSACNLHTKGWDCGALMFSLMFAWTSCWKNSQVAGEFRSHNANAAMKNETRHVQKTGNGLRYKRISNWPERCALLKEFFRSAVGVKLDWEYIQASLCGGGPRYGT